MWMIGPRPKPSFVSRPGTASRYELTGRARAFETSWRPDVIVREPQQPTRAEARSGADHLLPTTDDRQPRQLIDAQSGVYGVDFGD